MKLIYYHHHKNGQTEGLPMRQTYYDVLVILLRGEMDFVVGKEKVPLKVGDALMAREWSYFSRKQTQDVEFVIFNFQYANDENPPQLPVHIKNCVTKEIKTLLFACDEIFALTENFTEQLTLLTQCIIKQIYDDLSQKTRNPITLQIINYINANVDKKITLSEVCAQTFFSQTYCSRIFRKDMGKSILDYAIERKIEEVKKLIAQNLPLKEIAEKLNFGSYNYLSRIFTEREGISPFKYKQLFCHVGFGEPLDN